MRRSVTKLATNIYTSRKIETNRAVLTQFGYTAGPSTIQFAPFYVERTQCLHKETSKACARRTADSATTTWHIIVGQYRKSSISEYSNIRGLFGTSIRSQILVFVTALVPPLSAMAAVSKAFTPLPRKSDRSDTEVSERRQSHTLRFGKCQMVRLHLT